MIFISATVNVIHVIKFMWSKKIIPSVADPVCKGGDPQNYVLINSVSPMTFDLPAQNLQFTAISFVCSRRRCCSWFNIRRE